MWCSKVARAQKAMGTAAVLVPGWHAQAGVREHRQVGQVWNMYMIQQKISLGVKVSSCLFSASVSAASAC